jgi:hypothetical protein
MSRQSIGVANEAPTLAERVVTLGTLTTNLDPAVHANRLLLISTADVAYAINLPRCTGSGDVYKFLVTVAKTSGSIVISAHVASSNVISGTITNHGSSNVVTKFSSTSNDIITLNATTQGGQAAGDYLELVDVAAGAGTGWRVVRGQFSTSGSAASPFSGGG